MDDEVAGPRQQAEDVVLISLVRRPAVVGLKRRGVLPRVDDDELVGAVEGLGDVVGATARLGAGRGGGAAQEGHEVRVGHGDPMHTGDGDLTQIHATGVLGTLAR